MKISCFSEIASFVRMDPSCPLLAFLMTELQNDSTSASHHRFYNCKKFCANFLLRFLFQLKQLKSSMVQLTISSVNFGCLMPRCQFYSRSASKRLFWLRLKCYKMMLVFVSFFSRRDHGSALNQLEKQRKISMDKMTNLSIFVLFWRYSCLKVCSAIH